MNVTKPEVTPSGLAESLSGIKSQSPIHRWNPPFCGDIDMRILRDGSWLYMGTPISRPAMVKLFSTVLRREEDDCYYLVTPAEKVRIQVDDAPFLAISLQQEKDHLVFTTNTGDQVPLKEGHELRVLENPQTREPSPYIRVRDRLDALIHRNIFYQLIDISEERQVDGKTQTGVCSFGNFYSLGCAE